MPERSWEILEGACLHCRKCRLWETRTHVVVGKGNRNADILFVGEGPGYHEDMQGVPFVGPAGQLLDKIMESVGLTMDDVYITNIVKCRPPGNRDPHEDEQEKCMNYLRYQLLLIRPKIIVCLGRISGSYIIGGGFRITRDRGRWIERKGYQMTAVFHPSALLRDEEKKKPTYEDFKEIKRRYDMLRENKKE